jgi:isopenicillin-N epimerase
LHKAAEQLGALVGAEAEDIVFVENATAGCNTVLQSIWLRSGDEVLVLAHGYQAVRNATRTSLWLSH